MAQHTNVPREILDSIRDGLDRRIKLSIKRLVNYETKKDKVEQRILAFSTYRLFIFTAKSPTKVETNFHYLDLTAIESKKANQIVFTTNNKSYTFTTLNADTDEVNHMITHIGTSLKTIFPAFPLERLIKKIDVQPPDRLRVMQDMMKGIEKKEVGPCGGFTLMYSCMCDFHNLAYRDEVAWDVDTIYLSQDNRELCLRDFDHLKERDLVPIVSALVNNTWFTSLNANNVRLTPDVCAEILRVMKKNCVMEALLLSNTGITSEFVRKLSTLSMSDTQLHTLDLSNNMIDDIGAEHLFGSLSSRGKTVNYIDLSGTRVTTKGLNKMAEAMNRHPHVFSSLQTLKLANITSNKVEDLQNMYTFFASPNMISHLDLTGTDFEIEKLLIPLQRGSGQSLIVLKLGKMAYTHKKSREVVVPSSYKKFFASVCALQHLDLSGAKLPPEALKEMLLGLGCNRNIKSLQLDLSGMDLQSQGAQHLQACLTSMRNINSLNISNIVFQDQDLCAVIRSIGQNKNVKHLNIGRVFNNIKFKNLKTVMEELVQVIQDEDSAIESLSLADSKLKDSMNLIVNALGSNSSLTEVDISGNMMGDLGAKMLSKALQINNKLRSIFWDKNNTTCMGFEDVATALEKNYTLKKMPMPIFDAALALKTHPEKTEQALQRIELLLQRNHSPQKYSSDQAYRLQQGFLISSTQQMVDRLVVQSQDTINALTIDSSDAYRDDVEKAQAIIKDADNSKSLLPSLHDIAIQSQTSGNPVEKKLKEIANELKTVLEVQMKKTVEDMLTATKKQCTELMKDTEFVEDVQKGCVEKSALPKDFTNNILDGVDTDIFNKLSELNLAVAAHVSDQVLDEVIERLSHTHKTLTNHLNEKKKVVLRRSQIKTQKMQDEETNQMVKGTDSPQDSPHVHTKRKSMHARKLRPQSVVDALDDPEHPPRSKPSLTSSASREELVEDLDVVPELSSGPKLLTNVTKNRARRVKNIRPSPRQSALPGTTGDVKVDENVGQFFNKPTSPAIADGSSSSSKSSSTKSTPETKKKSGGLFGSFSKKGEDKEKKRGLLNKKSKQSPPVAGKKGSRVSDVQEKEEEEEVGVTNNVQKSIKEDTPKSPKDVKASGKEDTVSEKSIKSTGSDSGTSDSSGDKLKEETEKKTKKPLQLPKFKSQDKVKEEKKEVEKKETEVEKKETEVEKKETEEDKKAEEEKDTAGEEKVDVENKNESKDKESEEESDEEEEEEEEDSKESSEEEDSDKVVEEEKEAKDDKGKKEEEETEKEEEPVKKEAEAVEEPAPVLRKPPGIGLGFGANILSEMKQKQELRKSMVPNLGKPAGDDKPTPPKEEKSAPFFERNLKPVKLRTSDSDKSTPENPASKPAPDSEKKNVFKDLDIKKSEPTVPARPFGLKPSDLRKTDPEKSVPLKPSVARLANSDKSPASAKLTKNADVEKASKPVDNLSSAAEKKDSQSPGSSRPSSTSSSLSDTGVVKRSSFKESEDNGKPLVAKRPIVSKPPPPTRPKPSVANKPTPAPRRSGGSTEITDDVDHKTEENPEMTDSGIGPESDTPKLSVKEAAAKLGAGDSGRKSGSLPRNMSPTKDKDVSDTPKRPRSMFAVLDSRPDLKPDRKLTDPVEEETKTDKTSDPSPEEPATPKDDVIMV